MSHNPSYALSDIDANRAYFDAAVARTKLPIKVRYLQNAVDFYSKFLVCDSEFRQVYVSRDVDIATDFYRNLCASFPAPVAASPAGPAAIGTASPGVSVAAHSSGDA